MDIIEAWFYKARQDMRTAQILARDATDLESTILFHCQQCAEKAIKGFLAFHKVRFDKTHDLGKLNLEVLKIDADLSRALEKVEPLISYAVIYRYPGFDDDSDLISKVSEALTLAQFAYEEISRRLPMITVTK